ARAAGCVECLAGMTVLYVKRRFALRQCSTGRVAPRVQIPWLCYNITVTHTCGPPPHLVFLLPCTDLLPPIPKGHAAIAARLCWPPAPGAWLSHCRPSCYCGA